MKKPFEFTCTPRIYDAVQTPEGERIIVSIDWDLEKVGLMTKEEVAAQVWEREGGERLVWDPYRQVPFIMVRA